jgi:hypothetical protein
MNQGLNSVYLFVLAVLFCTLTSCSLRKGANSAYSASFRSYANGLADLNLQLDADMKFSFVMTILPEPGTGDTLPETFTFNGKWHYEQDKYVIRFASSDQIDLFALVDPSYEPATNVIVVDNRTLAFPLEAQEVVIWGIVCYRASTN